MRRLQNGHSWWFPGNHQLSIGKSVKVRLVIIGFELSSAWINDGLIAVGNVNFTEMPLAPLAKIAHINEGDVRIAVISLTERLNKRV